MAKILIIAYAFPPELGGAENVAYNYALWLQSQGHKITVVCRACNGKRPITPFEVLEVKNRFGSKFWMFNYGLFFLNFNFDIYDNIIINGTSSVAASGRWLSDKTLERAIPIIQGQEVEIYNERRVLNRLFYNIFLKIESCHIRALMLSRKIVSVSEYHKNKFVNGVNLKKLEDKIQVVYTGIDKKIFYPIDTDFRQKYNLVDNTILLTVSRIVKMKGFLEMFEIFKKIYECDKSFVWLIIGVGDFLNELKRMSLDCGLNNNILFLGCIDNNRLNYYYSAANCFWLLSNFDECLPLVYLEAQSCGLPVIGRNKGGVRETIIDLKTGFLINNDEECYDVIVNKKFRNIEKNDMVEFLDKFDPMKSAKQLIS